MAESPKNNKENQETPTVKEQLMPIFITLIIGSFVFTQNIIVSVIFMVIQIILLLIDEKYDESIMNTINRIF